MFARRAVSPVRSTPAVDQEMESPPSTSETPTSEGVTVLPTNQVAANGLQPPRENEYGDVKPLLSAQQVRTGDVIS